MTVVARGKGRFEVYSGETGRYDVNLVAGTCDCPAAKYQEGKCKHLIRVRQEAGLAEIPDLGARRLDIEIMMNADGEETEPVAIADGGMVAPEPQGESGREQHAPGCENDECEGIDADADRPILSFACWTEWAAYDEEELIEEPGHSAPNGGN